MIDPHELNTLHQLNGKRALSSAAREGERIADVPLGSEAYSFCSTRMSAIALDR